MLLVQTNLLQGYFEQQKLDLESLFKIDYVVEEKKISDLMYFKDLFELKNDNKLSIMSLTESTKKPIVVIGF